MKHQSEYHEQLGSEHGSEFHSVCRGQFRVESSKFKASTLLIRGQDENE
jgi:hypothetical protein